jgi:hypothetical protein
MIEAENFLKKSSEKIFADKRILALCIGGSWIHKEIDKYSDLDLILITRERLSSSKDTMYEIASNIGEIVAGFTGDHVGEKRLFICLYKNPILHVDLKFLEPFEFDDRIENPLIIWERENIISSRIGKTEPGKESIDYQWIEDRFWIWIHYAATKLGRGELFEALDFLSFMRTRVIGPLYQIKYGHLPRGVRKIDFRLNKEDINAIKSTIAGYSFDSIKESMYNTIKTYKKLRNEIFPKDIKYLTDAEETSIHYLNTIVEEM